MLWQHETLFSQSTKALLDVMGKASVTRLVAVAEYLVRSVVEVLNIHEDVVLAR